MFGIVLQTIDLGKMSFKYNYGSVMPAVVTVCILECEIAFCYIVICDANPYKNQEKNLHVQIYMLSSTSWLKTASGILHTIKLTKLHRPNPSVKIPAYKGNCSRVWGVPGCSSHSWLCNQWTNMNVPQQRSKISTTACTNALLWLCATTGFWP